MSFCAISVVGIGDDGCLSLSARAHNAICKASVLFGGERVLAFFSDFSGEKIPLKGKLLASIDAIIARSYEENVVVLASGDPMFFGIGSLIVKKAGAEHVTIIPQPSSMQWAFAKAKIPSSDATFISLHGRPLAGLAAKLQRTRKAGLFTDEENCPQRIASQLLEYGLSHFEAILCENLCGPEERVRRFSLPALAKLSLKEVSPLNVLLLVAPSAPKKPLLDLVSEDEYGKRMPKKGLITKKEVRVLSLAAMALTEESVVWDVGAGSGSLSVEAGRLASRGEIYAVECDSEGVSYIEDNKMAHGMDQIRAVYGLAPKALEDLPRPNAVFVGGSKGSLADIVQLASERLYEGGRLVVNAVTMENVVEAKGAFTRLGWPYDMSLIQVSRGVPLAKKYLKYEALNPIHMFYAQKPSMENT